MPRRILPARSARQACTALLVTTALGLPAAAALRGQTAGEPRAVVPEIGHNFGAVEPGSLVSHTFVVRNAGTAPLTIRQVEFSEPGFRSRFKGTLLPGEAGPVTVEWDVSQSRGTLDARAVLHLSDPKRPRVTYALTGVITRSIDLRPSSDVFLSVYTDQGAARTVTIVNGEATPLAVTGLRPKGDHFTAELRTVTEGEAYEVAVRVEPGLEPGRYVESIEVDTDHPRLSTLRLGVHIFVREEVYAEPGAVNFGEVRMRTPGSPTPAALSPSLTLRKRDGDFAILSIDSDVSALRIDRTPSGRSDTFGLLVSIDPERLEQSRNLEGTIRVKTDDPKFPVIEIPVTGRVR